MHVTNIDAKYLQEKPRRFPSLMVVYKRSFRFQNILCNISCCKYVNMPRGTSFTKAKRIQVDVLLPDLHQGKSPRQEIARRLDRSDKVFQNYLLYSKGYNL